MLMLNVFILILIGVRTSCEDWSFVKSLITMTLCLLGFPNGNTIIFLLFNYHLLIIYNFETGGFIGKKLIFK